MTRVLALLALVLLAGFFLPWFGGDAGQMFGAPNQSSGQGGSLSMSGFEMTWGVLKQTIALQDAGNSDAFEQSLSQLWFVWALAAIPIFGVLTLLAGLAGSGLAGAFAFLAGVVPVGEAIYLFSEAGSSITDLFMIGAWLTLGASVLLVLLAFVPRRG